MLAVATYAVLSLGMLELPPRKDEIIPGIARTPDADEIDMGKMALSGGHGHMHIKLVGGDAVTACPVGAGAGGGGGVMEVGGEPVWPQGRQEPAAGGGMPVSKLIPCADGEGGGDAMDGGAAAGGIGAAELSGAVGAAAVLFCDGGSGFALGAGIPAGGGAVIVVTVIVLAVPWRVIVCSLPLIVTVDAGPLSPGVKPATTPGVLVRLGGGAAAGGAAGALLAGGGAAAAGALPGGGGAG